MTTPAPSLKALAEAKADGIQKLTIFTVDPDAVHIEPGWNGRDETPDLLVYRQALKAAMKAGAFVPPIDVQMVDGTPVVRDGHSRTLMARELKAEGTPYVLQARQLRGNDADMIYHMLGSGTTRGLGPLEAGRQYLRLLRMGTQPPAIAERLGISVTTVTNGIALAEMPSAVQGLVVAGKVAPHQALKTVKAHGAREATGVLKEAIKAAEAKGKTKATGKHIEPKAKPQVLPPAAAPAPAPTLPPVTMPADFVDLVRRLAAVNIVVSQIDRNAVAQLVQDARKLVEGL